MSEKQIQPFEIEEISEEEEEATYGGNAIGVTPDIMIGDD
jgi:hypothetical protein